MHPPTNSDPLSAAGPEEHTRGEADSGTSQTDFFVVGIGASAGALESISEILRRLPADCNLAIVVVQHLDPTHESILVDLLTRASTLPVSWASQGQRVAAGSVYVAPPKTCLEIKRGMLALLEADRHKSGGDIDHFLRTLANDTKHRSVGVILSGNGMDGTNGAKAIKGAGGVVFAQEPSSASFASMPRAVIEAGCADRVLPPSGIADALVKLSQRALELWQQLGARDEAAPAGNDAEHVQSILRLVAARARVDFSEYKQSTVSRRLVRQMMLSKSAHFADYLKLLQKDRSELERLYESLLINVTEFFRDPEYFEFLKESIVPEIMERHSEYAPLRIWVPGCATGEEAYSLGILLDELIYAKGLNVPVQIFGTDIGDRALTVARAGRYSPTDVAKVSPDRLRRYFHPADGGYVIQKHIRDLCIFARQNVARDSPFSRMDLISCRNLLIYFGPKLQQKLMSVFHYALKPGGYLMLGNSESIGGNAGLFALVDRRFRIYSRKDTGRRTMPDFVGPPAADPVTTGAPVTPAEEPTDPFDIVREADRIVLSRHGPSGVVVNDELEIVQYRGDVSAYLAPTPGRASLNLFRMAREGLAGELQAAINEVRMKNVRVNRQNVRVVHGTTATPVDIDVTPLSAAHSKERFYLVLFTASRDKGTESAPRGSAKVRKTSEDSKVAQLRQDLEATRVYLQSAFQRHEATNQELRAANEEIQSSNEELQSTNEELETAKEELQSTNEELTTVNEELHSRQLELLQLNSDLHNLINSVHLPIVILTHDMRIRRFTPMAEKVLKMIPGDIGRPLSDINIGLTVEDLPRLISEVMDSLSMHSVEVQDRDGRWFSLRIRPYKTADNKIDGVVLTLFDIDAMKRTLAEAEEARQLADAVIETAREPLAVLTAELKIERANEAFYRLFKTAKSHAEGRAFFDIVKQPDKVGGLKRSLESVLPAGTSLTNHQLSIDLPDADHSPVMVNVRRVASSTKRYPLILVSIHPH